MENILYLLNSLTLAVALWLCILTSIRIEKTIKDDNKNEAKTNTKHLAAKPHRETREERLERISLENIDNYGKDVPQKEVE